MSIFSLFYINMRNVSDIIDVMIYEILEIKIDEV